MCKIINQNSFQLLNNFIDFLITQLFYVNHKLNQIILLTSIFLNAILVFLIFFAIF